MIGEDAVRDAYLESTRADEDEAKGCQARLERERTCDGGHKCT
jgi:hypothetical protein